MNTNSIYARLSKSTGARIEGLLKNGHYYLRGEKHYAVFPTFNALAFGETDEISQTVQYKTIVIGLNIEVDFYIMRDEFDFIVTAIKRRFDDEYAVKVASADESEYTIQK